MAKLLDGASVDLVVTDPPYNVAYTGGTKEALTIENDDMSDEAFSEFLVSAFENMRDALKAGGAFYIWHADSAGFVFRGACAEVGLSVRQCLIWNKNSLVLGRQDYQWKHEPCLYGWKDGAAHYFIMDRTQTTVFEDERDFDKMKKSELVSLLKTLFEGETYTSVISERRPSRSSEHPTMKPVKLMGRLIQNSSLIGGEVLDLFGGSGSTLIACEQLMRTCYMLELDPRYVDVIIDRWETFTGKKAEKL